MITIQNIAGQRVRTETNHIVLDGLEKTHARAERRRLDGEKLTQAESIVRKTKYITPMASVRVLDEIAKDMMPERMG